MTRNFMANLEVPSRKVDIVLDTDAFRQVDDQFAIGYLLGCYKKLNIKALFAAPFFLKGHSFSPKDGMEKSYHKIIELLKLAKREDLIPLAFRGCIDYLDDEKASLFSEASANLVGLAKNYTPRNPLYVVALGCITNIASALLIDPTIAENIVIVWLGGHCYSYPHTKEFNMFQDIAAARVVFKSRAPLIQLTFEGVVSNFSVSSAEVEYYLKGKNELCDYLVSTFITETENLPSSVIPSMVLGGVAAIGWLMNDNNKFMRQRIVPSLLPDYDGTYLETEVGKPITYVHSLDRIELLTDMITKIVGLENYEPHTTKNKNR